MGTLINKLNGLNWTADDLQKKFTGSYVQATILDTNTGKPLIEKKLVYISNPGYCMNSSGTQMGVQYHANTSIAPGVVSWGEKMAKWKDFLIEEDRPDPCITNTEKGAVMFNYNPDRQWKRGFNGFNSFLHFAPDLITRTGLSYWNREIAELILNPSHSYLDDAIKQLRDNSLLKGRALNNRYWVVRESEENVIKLYRRKAFMGSFIGKKFFISDSARILDEELRTELPILKDKYA
jgi:hypothetical protein